MGSCVTFFGNQVNVAPYLNAVDIFCLCSAEPEGCSNAILEAMALGKPVIATDAGGNHELIKDGKSGFLVPVKDPKALARALIKCIKQPQMRKEMGLLSSQLFKERFSLERMLDDYQRLYQELIKYSSRNQP
jgi:glycosyltransferase involved in cell wall biosynthesis